MTRFRVVTFVCFFLIHSTATADSGLWQVVSARHSDASTVGPVKQRLYRADTQELRRVLSRAGFEGRAQSSSTIELPVANGQLQQFNLEESSIMAPGLAARYPEIKTYRVRGVDDPYSSGRLSISPKGFHAMITGPDGTYYIDPTGNDNYRAYRKQSQIPSEPFNCGVQGHDHTHPAGDVASRPALRTAGSLRVYRLAVAGTYEYVSLFGGKNGAMDEITNAINRVNQIYERDLGIRLILVDNNDDLLFTTASDPYTNNNGYAMLDQNQTTIDSIIQPGSYDIGHVFSTGGGGIAEVGSVCSSLKAGGVTGLYNPTGDAFYIDYVAHEIGHQFSAEHSFNGTSGGCAGNRWQSTAFEPGSGSTIMSYAGICGFEDIADNALAVFHAGSIGQIDSFTTSGQGASCGLAEAINNPSEPTANAGSDHTIPAYTPFVLTALGSDADGDAITYSWDQMDAGTATNASSFGQDLGNNSLFRSYAPRTINERHFPALGTTLRNKSDYSEVLPCRSRNINFRLTVLDGNSGIARDNVVISVDNTSGPFQITSHTTAQTISSTEVVSWDVANTNKSPVNCTTVDISLLTFNASLSSYAETMLSSNEVNDGSALVSIPYHSSSKARFKIQCSNNVFYDISNADLVINGESAFTTSDKAVFYNLDGENNLLLYNSPKTCSPEPVVESTSGGGSSSLYWVLNLLALGILRKRIIRLKKPARYAF